jgi:Ca2+-binding EF-hand superfamily protein
MRAFGFQPGNEEINNMMSEIYCEGKGVIEFADFLELMARKISARDPTEEIMKAFMLFDDDRTGKISLRNLKKAAR